MSPIIKVLLIEDNRIEARQTQHWLGTARDGVFDVETVDQLKLALERLAQGGVDIVLLDLNLPDSRGLETFTRLHGQFPAMPTVVLTGEYDEAIGPSAVEQGAQDYLVKQQADSVSLTRVLKFALARHRAQAELLRQSRRVNVGKILGFVGAKGGVGTTTCALNVALVLATRNHSVVLVELHPESGTLTHHLQMEPVANLSTLLDLPAARIDESSLSGALCRGPAELKVLFAPQPDRPFRVIEPEAAVAIVRGLARMADFVIVDFPHVPTVAAQETIPLCHHMIVVSEREPGSLNCAKGVLHRLHSWGVGSNLVGTLIVNRTIYPISLEMSKVRARIGCDLIGSVGSDANACLQAQESGVPMVLSAPDHDISLSFQEIADRISAEKIMAKFF